MFGKLMSISDELMWRYFILLSTNSIEAIEGFRKETENGRNPRDFKVMLAQEIITRFHNAAAAEAALQNFEARFRDGQIPDDIPEVELSGAPLSIVHVLRDSGLASSGSEANRNIQQGGVRVDGQRIEDRGLELATGTYVIQVGKRKFARITIS
ncbi:tyrosine--tRNA ligase [Oligella ureolytica]